MAAEAPPQQAPTRVCPHCATVAQTVERTCPWCRRHYRRRILPAVLLALLVQTVLVLAGVGLMLLALGDEVQRRVDDSAQEIRGDINRDVADALTKVQSQLRAELDNRLPATSP